MTVRPSEVIENIFKFFLAGLDWQVVRCLQFTVANPNGEFAFRNPRGDCDKKIPYRGGNFIPLCEIGSISRLIFSGVIILGAHTMGLPCRNEGRENVSCIGTNSYLHGDGCKRQKNGAAEKKKRTGKWAVVIDCVFKCPGAVCRRDKNYVVTCVTAQWAFRSCRKPVTVRSQQAMACWQ